MPPHHPWAVGDRVVHPTKPEWGTGRVDRAEATTHEGSPCQRLTIRFERAGTKTISTAFAKLKPAGDAPIRKAQSQPKPAGATPKGPATPPGQPEAASSDAAEGPPEPQLDAEQAALIMAALPSEATDAFLPLPDRLAATLRLYRHEATGRGLLDWASIQTGLADPLSLFSRHDLEAHFDRFRVRLDRHLAELLRACRREKIDPRPITAAAGPEAKRALSRINAHR